MTQHKLVSPLNLNRIYVSLFTVIGLFFLLFESINYKLNKIGIPILVIFLMLLSSKTIIISSFSIIVLLFLRKNYFVKTQTIIIIPILFFGLIILSNRINKRFVSELIPNYDEIINTTNFNKNYYFNGAELRILYTRFLIEYELENPSLLITGFGINASQEKIEKKCIQYNVPEGYGVTFNFHNQYNQTLAESGIFALVLLVYSVLLAFSKAWKNKDYFGVSSILLLSILMFTESILNRQRGIYMFLVLMFIIYNTTFKKSTQKINK